MVVKAKRRLFEKVHIFESASLTLKARKNPLAQEHIPMRGGYKTSYKTETAHPCSRSSQANPVGYSSTLRMLS